MGNKLSSGSTVHQSNASDSYLSALFDNCCENGIFERKLFEKYFESDSPVDLFSSQLSSKLFTDDVLSKAAFERILQDLLDCAYKTQEYQLRYFTDIHTNGKSVLQRKDIHNILMECLKFSVNTSTCIDNIKSKDSMLITSMVESCIECNSELSTNAVINWLIENQLRIYAGLNGWIHKKLGRTIHMSVFHMLPYPQHQSDQLLTLSMMWYFCLVLPPCYVRLEKEHHSAIDDEKDDEGSDHDNLLTWQPLYNSDDHGLSINRLKKKCFDYKSPTISLIKMKSGTLVALALDQHWIDSPENFGGSYCQLIEIHPKFQVLESASKLVYLKEQGRSIAKGLHLGSGKPAKIEINSDLDEVCMIYKQHTTDHVIKMEVWGCGGAKATEQQKNQKKWDAKETEKRKKVKHPGDWHDNPDRSILEMGGVTVSHQDQ